jgi:hypothetical protein
MKIWGLRWAVCSDFAGIVGDLIYFKKNENLEIFGCVFLVAPMIAFILKKMKIWEFLPVCSVD